MAWLRKTIHYSCMCTFEFFFFGAAGGKFRTVRLSVSQANVKRDTTEAVSAQAQVLQITNVATKGMS